MHYLAGIYNLYCWHVDVEGVVADFLGGVAHLGCLHADEYNAEMIFVILINKGDLSSQFFVHDLHIIMFD